MVKPVVMPLPWRISPPARLAKLTKSTRAFHLRHGRHRMGASPCTEQLRHHFTGFTTVRCHWPFPYLAGTVAPKVFAAALLAGLLVLSEDRANDQDHFVRISSRPQLLFSVGGCGPGLNITVLHARSGSCRVWARVSSGKRQKPTTTNTAAIMIP